MDRSVRDSHSSPVLCAVSCPCTRVEQGVLRTHSNLTSGINSGSPSALTTVLGWEQDPLSPPQPRTSPSPTPASCRLPSPSPCPLPPKKHLHFQGLPFCYLTKASTNCLPHLNHGDCRSENWGGCDKANKSNVPFWTFRGGTETSHSKQVRGF